MNEIMEPSGSTEVADYNPARNAMDIHGSQAAERAARTAKNPEALKAAIATRLTAQGEFAREYKKLFQHGGDRKSSEFQADSAVGLNSISYCEQYGFHERTVQRWAEKLIDPDSLKSEIESRYAKICNVLGLEVGENYSSKKNEWYTPPIYIEKVKNVLGGIDLDPASCEESNNRIKAKNYFSEDALIKNWFGRVFMNPPYGTESGESVAGLFCQKAIEEYKKGNVTEAIILVNSSHSQKWQQPLYEFPICFVDHRIAFIASGDGEPNKNPTFQNIFIYLGGNKEKFADEFSVFGYVMEKVKDA
jgi:hypothetical protein